MVRPLLKRIAQVRTCRCWPRWRTRLTVAAIRA